MIKRVAVASTTFDMSAIAARLAGRRPMWEVFTWPDPRCADAQLLITWNCPPELAERMRQLELVHGIAAGTDNILPAVRAANVPVCRVVDASQVAGMTEYVRWSVLHFHRGFDAVLQQQRARQWSRPEFRGASDVRVGVMGLGEMGTAVARSLAGDGYRVRGFSRTPRHIEGVECHASESFPLFLSDLEILVCLLPLTPSTRGILDRRTFEQLAPRAALIHAGRGEHLVHSDLANALLSGRMRGAIVDVFAVEPLPPGDPLWSLPGMLVTPHMATRTHPDAIVDRILDNVHRFEAGQPLLHAIDARRGY